jgi:hypothetical protein
MNYHSKVAVEFLPQKEGESSKIVYMTEPQIRALQTLVAERVKLSDWETTQKWLATFIVYDGRTKRGSRPMQFRPDGRFVNDFQPGFMNVISDLAIELFD